MSDSTAAVLLRPKRFNEVEDVLSEATTAGATVWVKALGAASLDGANAEAVERTESPKAMVENFIVSEVELSEAEAFWPRRTE